MKILLNSDIPIYKQISTDFKERIMNGTISCRRISPLDKRTCQKSLKISVITTMKAYEELCSEGLSAQFRGKGLWSQRSGHGYDKGTKYMRLLEQHLQDALDCAKACRAIR